MDKWTLSGFDAISRGVFENGGQNLYVSHNGVIQRIWRFDVNNDGYVDLLIANSHDYNEHPKLYIIKDPAGEARQYEVLTQGAQTAAVGDLNHNGYDDLVIGTMHDGHHIDLASYVFFGGKDGVTENRKIDLAAPACTCCGIGDFDGDGKKEICYLVADGPERSSPTGLYNGRLRVYRQDTTGFHMNAFHDYPTDITYFQVADIDGDGCDDLYCRTKCGEWLILWGGKEGFSRDRCTVVGDSTDDSARFNLLPFGGGNVVYNEFARPKVISFNGTMYLFYSDANQVRFIHFNKRSREAEVAFPIRNVISADTGHIEGSSLSDIVFLQIDDVNHQQALVYFGSRGYDRPVKTLFTRTPRDVLVCDFSGNGFDDIAIAQGRDSEKFTTESLLYLSEVKGQISGEPRKFTTHNCVEVMAGDFDGDGKKELVFVNQQQSSAYGHVPVYIYLGSANGFTEDNRIELPGHSAGTMIPADFNDDGWPDVLLLHNAEDQPVLRPAGCIYWGGPDGFEREKKTDVPTYLSWGGQCADLNRDGYLDIVSSGGNSVRILYGGPNGYSEEHMVELNVIEGEPEDAAAGSLWFALADLNGNGWLDIIVPVSWQPYSIIFWGGPDGYSHANSTRLPLENGLTVRVADLNRDGYPDLVFGSRASYYRNTYHEGTVTIFWGGPDGYSGFNCCVLPSYQTNCITIADFNNNGWLDIFASSYFHKRERDINSFLYWNTHGSFSLTNRKRFFSHSSSAAWAGDFNEDGYVDLCVTNHRAYGAHRTESAIWWNGPDGFSEENRTWLPTIGPHDMVPTDMGNLMTRGPEEYYMAPAGRSDHLTRVGWTGVIPPKTWVNCQVRSAASQQQLEQETFFGRDGTENTRFECDEEIPPRLLKGCHFQIKLFFGAVNSGNSPRITEIYAE